MRNGISLLIIFGLFFFIDCYGSYSGLTLSYPLITQDPENLHGGRFSLWFQPDFLQWERTRVFFDGSLGYWWVSEDIDNNKINIFSFAPVLRYDIVKHPYLSPFIEISIGFSYLSSTRIADRNLGEHFSFQDQLGFGLSIGREKKISVSMSALHYSNASLCNTNAGMTIPLLFNVGYRF